MRTSTEGARGAAKTCAALALGVVLLCGAGAAQAHERLEEHRAIVSLRPDGRGGLEAEALLMMEIPSGPRSQRLGVAYDLNRDGTLQEAELVALADALGPEVIGGWVLREGGRAPTPLGAQARARVTPAGGVVVAVFLRYELGGVPGTVRRISAHVLPKPAGKAALQARALKVELQAEGGVELRGSAAPIAQDAPVVGPVVVEPGGEVWVEVVVGGAR